MNDEKLTEYCQSVQRILLADNFTTGQSRSIAAGSGIQFSLSREGKTGLLRIYQRRSGTFTIDYSLLKDPEFLKEVRHILDEMPPSVSSRGIVPGLPTGTSIDPGYPVIGTDESGKGDYFGPLVCAAVCLDEATAEILKKSGVRDSKTCSNREIRELAEKIKTVCAGRFEIIEITPDKYNRLYGQMKKEGKNLNTLLAWGHAKAIEELLTRVDCTVAVADQFADKRFILGKLQEKGRTIRVIQMHRAEQNIAVAAASVLARARFLEKISVMSRKYAMILPLGASAAVIRAAKEFTSAYGFSALPLVAKMHFKTTTEFQKEN